MKSFSFAIALCALTVMMSLHFANHDQQRVPAAQSSENTYHKPLEILKNDGKELVLRVNKGIIEESEDTKSTDFVLYYNVEFNMDFDKLPRAEKKVYKEKMRNKFTQDEGVCLTGTAQECMEEVMSYTIQLEAGDEWRTIRLPITERGKYTIHFYREGVQGRLLNDATVKSIAGEGSRMSRFLFKSVSFLTGRSNKQNRDVAFAPVWKQDIFVEPAHKTSQEKIDEIAKKYAPVSFMHSTEEYLPTSIEYMLNEVDKDPALDEEMFEITLDSTLKGKGLEFKRGRKVEFPYKDMRKVLPYSGDQLMVLSSKEGTKKTRLRYRTGTPEDATVYYSFMENETLRYAFLNYHYLFPFDPKTGTAEKPALPAHTFDRESVTIVLDLDSLEPIFIVYGAHLPNQLMAIIDKNIKNFTKLQSWLGGRVKQYWKDADKVDGTHPIISMAQGSHGIYPVKGTYIVSMELGATIDTLTEGADGEQILYPNNINFDKKKLGHYKKSTSYKIKNLELGRITSTSWNSMLAFSGDTVNVLGPVNAKFPPYTGREFAIEDYILGDDCQFDPDAIDPISARFVPELENCYTEIATRKNRREIYNWQRTGVDKDTEAAINKEIEFLNSIILR